MSMHTFQPAQAMVALPSTQPSRNGRQLLTHRAMCQCTARAHRMWPSLPTTALVQPEDVNHNTSQLPSGTPPEDVWRAEGVQAPHDFALTAAPTPSKGNGDRAVAVLVAETRMRGSSLRKFILLPEGDGGTSDPAPKKNCKFLVRKRTCLPCLCCFLACCGYIISVVQLGAAQKALECLVQYALPRVTVWSAI